MDKFIFVGIQINHQSPHFSYISMNEDFLPLAIDHGDLENLLSYLAGQEKAILAINAPLHLNQGLLKNKAIQYHTPGKRPNIRLVESEIEAFQIDIYHTPDKIQKCEPEVKLGIELCEYLSELGFQEFPADSASKLFFETPANTAFWSLIEGNIISQENFIGQMQRQQILYDIDLHLTSPMEFMEELTRYKLKNGNVPFEMILPINELNAWVCAYTAFRAWKQPETLTTLGNEEEGFIFLPDFPQSAEPPTENFQEKLF